MTLAAVCIGSRPRNDHEAEVLEWCATRWRSLYPVHIADSDGDAKFNRSAARNNAAAAAGEPDVLIFANADTVFLDAHDITQAVHAAAASISWSLSARYIETSVSYTADALRANPTAVMPDPLSSYERQLSESPAGYQIVPRVWFEDIRGWDERFGSGWGWEDAAFRDALDVLHAPHERYGTAVHLWHPRGPELAPQANRPNRALWLAKYRRAAAQKTPERRRAAMRKAVTRP